MHKLLFFTSIISISILQAMTPPEFIGKTVEDFTKNKTVDQYVDSPIGDIRYYTDGSFLVIPWAYPVVRGRVQAHPIKYTLHEPTIGAIEFDQEGKFVLLRRTIQEQMKAAIDTRNPLMVSGLLHLRPQTLNVTLAPDQPILIYAIKKALEPNLSKEEAERSAEVIKRMLATGADPSITYRGQSAVQLASQRPHLLAIFVQAATPPTAEPLFKAIEQGTIKTVEQLLTERPASINARNNQGQTPLYVALNRARTHLAGRPLAALSPREKGLIGNFMTIAQTLLSKFKGSLDLASIKLLRENPDLLNLLSRDVIQRVQQQP